MIHRHSRRESIPALLAAMPVYTCGLLAPVPFVYAAVRLGVRRLWWPAGIYSAAWTTAWVLTVASSDNSPVGDAGGVLFLALAVICTAHAFALRASLPRDARLKALMASGEPLPPPEGDPINVTQLQAGLSALKTRVATHRYAFPPVCRQLLDDTIAAMEQVIAFVAANGHADAELRSVAAMLTDYLPTSLDTYLRLPKDYAERNPDGRTAAEELELQLRLLRDSAKDAVGSLYRGDALQLQQQSAFLESKFGTSELDLDR